MSTEGFNFKHTYAGLPEIFYQHQDPTPAPSPQMVIFNAELADELGLDSRSLKNAADIFSGSVLPADAKPIAMAYAGYQFGHFTMLGDGRAVLLGEQITPDGRHFDIQLKGSGLTPFSRNGDGLAALLPMLREYIVSEAMHSLGIPTTRSLAVALTGRDVIREGVLQGAVLTRVASSHIRVGTFNYISAYGTKKNVRTLADYCIDRHFPWLLKSENENKYILFLREVASRQASLIARWQLVGFIHGVMNTDNMAISGETIDFGPCAFMDSYDPDTVFSSIDTFARYSYKNQPTMGAWNLCRFAESLLPLLHKNEEQAIERAQDEIKNYWDSYNKNWLDGMRLKLGIFNEEEGDFGLASDLLDLMAKHKLDFTNTFRSLTGPHKGLDAWKNMWQARLDRQPQSREEATALMNKHNPAIIPRNHLVEDALSAASAAGGDDYSVMHSLLDALRQPYEEPGMDFKEPPASCNYKTFCGT